MMKLQEEILKIKNEMIDEFDKRVEALKEEEQEFPQDGDDYWFIDETGGLFYGNWDDYSFEKDMLSIGNVFKTKEQAEFAVEKLKVEAELRKFSRPFEHGEDNLTLNYHHKLNALVNVPAHSFYQEIGEFYFDNNDKINEAREAVGEDRIKKYIFGVED